MIPAILCYRTILLLVNQSFIGREIYKKLENKIICICFDLKEYVGKSTSHKSVFLGHSDSVVGSFDSLRWDSLATSEAFDFFAGLSSMKTVTISLHILNAVFWLMKLYGEQSRAAAPNGKRTLPESKVGIAVCCRIYGT